MRKIEYAGSVHDEAEIAAVLEVLQGSPTALRIGKQGPRARAGRRRALRQAARRDVQLGLQRALPRDRAAWTSSPGDEVIVPAIMFSTDVAPIVRAGFVPAFVDVEPDTFNIDVDAIEAMITPRTQGHPRREPDRQRPRLGSHPRDRRRARAPGRRRLVRRARRDVARHADRHACRHQPHELRVVAHHHRGRHRRDGAASTTTSSSTGALLLRRWGRRSEVQLYGSKKGVDKRFFSDDRRPRVRQPLHLRRGRLELRAVGALGRVRAWCS